jgi:hypothetical protein
LLKKSAKNVVGAVKTVAGTVVSGTVAVATAAVPGGTAGTAAQGGSSSSSLAVDEEVEPADAAEELKVIETVQRAVAADAAAAAADEEAGEKEDTSGEDDDDESEDDADGTEPDASRSDGIAAKIGTGTKSSGMMASVPSFSRCVTPPHCLPIVYRCVPPLTVCS